MATKTSAKVTSGTQAKGLRVGLVAVTAEYSLSAANSLSAGDVIQMVKVPAGATVIYVALSNGSGDALVTVGDVAVTNRYISSVTQSSAQPQIRTINTNFVPYTLSVDGTIDITIGTVSVGTITGGFRLQAIFSMDAGQA